MGQYQTVGGRIGTFRSDRELQKIRFPISLANLSFLDVGCAEGFFCFEAVRRGAKRVVGIDLKPERLLVAKGIARQRGMNIDFRLMNLFNLPVEKFDIVLFLSVIHHITNQREALKKLYDITSKILIAEIPISKKIQVVDGKKFVTKQYFCGMAKDAGWEKIIEVGSNKSMDRIVYHMVKS